MVIDDFSELQRKLKIETNANGFYTYIGTKTCYCNKAPDGYYNFGQYFARNDYSRLYILPSDAAQDPKISLLENVKVIFDIDGKFYEACIGYKTTNIEDTLHLVFAGRDDNSTISTIAIEKCIDALQIAMPEAVYEELRPNRPIKMSDDIFVFMTKKFGKNKEVRKCQQNE